MAYKICSTCQFIVPNASLLCTTCGSAALSSEDEILSSAISQAQPVITGRRITTTHYLPTIRPLRLATPPLPAHSVRRNERELLATRSKNPF